MNLGLTEEQTTAASIALLTGGKIFEQLSGVHEDEDIELDGKILMPGTIIRNCRLKIVTGDFRLLGGGQIDSNTLLLDGPALLIGKLVASGFQQPDPPPDEDLSGNNVH